MRAIKRQQLNDVASLGTRSARVDEQLAGNIRRRTGNALRYSSSRIANQRRGSQRADADRLSCKSRAVTFPAYSTAHSISSRGVRLWRAHFAEAIRRQHKPEENIRIQRSAGWAMNKGGPAFIHARSWRALRRLIASPGETQAHAGMSRKCRDVGAGLEKSCQRFDHRGRIERHPMILLSREDI